MQKKLKLRMWLFLVPLFILLIIFSFYPIVTSFVYSTFDYRTNDQQYNALRTSSALNGDLFAEDTSYVSFYLLDDISLFNEEDQKLLDELGRRSDELSAKYKGQNTLTAEAREEIETYIKDNRALLKELYGRPEYEGADFYRREDLAALFDNMETAFIPSNFVGLSHYQKLFSDQRFRTDLVHTLIFTAVSVSLELVLGMILALIMNAAVRGIGLVRTSALVPWAIPTAVSALMWQYLYDGRNGLVASIFASLGLVSSPEAMLSTGSGAMAAAIIADVWKTTPYMALLLLAGLQVIDRGLYESAAVDGAGKVKTFFTITLPLMKPSILVALLFRTLDAFRVYDLIAVLTGGGPGGQTETLSIYSYKVMIEQSNYGFGASIVVAMFLCVAIIAYVFIKFLGAELMGSD